MLINPLTAITEEWIQFLHERMEEGQLQPNGIDLRVREVFHINSLLPFELCVEETKHCPRTKLAHDSQLFFHLRKGNAYGIETYEYITMPKDVAALIYGRSSLNRNGLLARASLYDSGFQNYAGFTLYAFNDAKIQLKSRVAQMVFMTADSAQLYKGQYQDGCQNQDNNATNK